MRAWSGEVEGDIMGASVPRTDSGKPNVLPALKNGSDLRETGYLVAVGSRTARFRRKHKHRMFKIIMFFLLTVLFSLAIVMTVLYILERWHRPPILCESRECLRSAANLALSMDRTADPCENFYQFACGNWAEEHPRPDAYRSYDWFRDKETRVYSLVRDALGRNATHPRRPVQQAKDAFDACMDTETLDKRGLKPIVQILESLGLPPYPTYINMTEDFDYSMFNFDWVEAVIKVKTQMGMDVLIGFDLLTDPRNSSIYRLIMGSPETTNPFPSIHNEKKQHTGRRSLKNTIVNSRSTLDETLIFNNDNFFESKETKDDDEEEKIAQIYKIFYAELMKLFVVESGDIKGSKLSEIELDQNLLLSSNEYFTINNDMYELESDNDTDIDEDTFLNIPDYTVDEIQTHTDLIVESNNGTTTPIWKRYLEGIFSVSEVSLDFDNDKVLVSEPDMKYMALMASYFARTPPVLIELYIWVKVVEVMAVHTTTELRLLFQRSYDDMRKRGDVAPPPRSLQCAGAVNTMFGMAVTYAIADPHFINVTKPKIQIMLDEMKNSLAHLVGKARWMDDDTKLATYQKIIQMKTLIGFPDWLHEDGRLELYYEGVEVDRSKHLENMINVIQVKIKRVLNRFRQSHNFTWATDPTEVNAYHTFQENSITVPMVMVQYPFFDLGLDSLNYGSLGTVLGHEITHGFDNFGRKFDKNGNLLPWWTNATIESFVNITQCFVDQYSAYYLPELDEHVDGKKTLGENIADNGGMREALAALKHHLRKYGPEPKLPGFEHMTPEQLFFLSYGNLWCGVSTRESLVSDLQDEHSPQEFRPRGALQNSQEFARAWRCRPGSAMNPAKRCIVF